jgi:hypothetical protein
MKAIHNKTMEPLRVPLGGGKVLHLGPGQKGHIADDAAQSRGVRRLIEAGSVEVEGEDAHHAEHADGRGAPREFAHGHQHGNKVFPSGNRGG